MSIPTIPTGTALVTEDLIGSVKAAHRAFPTGVTIVTAQVQDRLVGLAVNAFSSVSMAPPTVLVCVNSSSQSHDVLYSADHLGISILSHDQSAVAANFARSGGDKFCDIDWHEGTAGAPLVDGAAAAFEVRVTSRSAVGTHTVFIGEIVGVEASTRPPLVYLGGRFYDGERLTEV